jgi:hypothetical protein
LDTFGMNDGPPARLCERSVEKTDDPAWTIDLAQRYKTIWRGSMVILAMSLLGAISRGAIRESFFDSDNLYLPTLFEDLIRWSGRFSDWRLTPAPYFLPDMPLYFLARLIAGSVEPAQYLSGIAHLLLFTWAARWLVRTLVRGTADEAQIVGLFIVTLALLHLTGSVALFGSLYHLTQHGGAALMTLVILRHCLGPPFRYSCVTAGALSLLTGVADPLFAASCGAPLLMLGCCASVQAVWKRVCSTTDSSRVTVRHRTLLSGALAFAGARLTNVVHAHMNSLPVSRSAGPSVASLLAALGDLTGSTCAVGMWLLAGVLLACTVLLLRRGAHARGLRIFALWQLGSVLSTLAAIGWAGNYLDSGSLRYMVVPFIMTAMLACAVVTHTLAVHAHRPEIARSVSFVSCVVIVALAATIVTQLPSIVFGQYRSNWRSTSSCVSAVLRREHADVVLADYWQAKPLMLFSDGHVRALQMRAKLRRPYFWINSRGWYRGPHHFGVVAVRDLDPDAIVQAFGEPARVDGCPGLDLFVYENGARDKLAGKMQRMFDRFVVDPHPL